MLVFVPTVFDLYRPLKAHLRWTLQCLVAFADRGGKCWPSIRTLAAVAGVSKSTAARHLAELARDGILTRQRRPGGCYAYTIAARFLPAARVSRKRDRAVPSARTEEQTGKKTEYAQARFAKPGLSFSEMPDDRAKWEARLRSWRKSGFWLPSFGPKPTDAGCFAPSALLQNTR